MLNLVFRGFPLYIVAVGLLLAPLVQANTIFTDSFSSQSNTLLDGQISDIGTGWTVLIQIDPNAELGIREKGVFLSRFLSQPSYRSGVITGRVGIGMGGAIVPEDDILSQKLDDFKLDIL